MDRSLTLRQALQDHLAAEGFPPDGGNGERWVSLRVGPVPLCIPNLPVRRRATLPHDLNHVVSGYGHDAIGEAEISAWELGGGCGGYVAAWFLVRSGLLLGLVAPRRMFRAFVRGRRTGNLFTRDHTALLDTPLADVRASMGLDEAHEDWSWRDLASFLATALSAPVAALVPGTVSLLTSPVWLAQGAHRRRRLPGG